MDGLVVGGLTEQIHGDDAARLEAKALRFANGSVETAGVEIEVVPLHIDEDGRCACKHNHLGRRNERECRYEYGVAGTDAFGHQDEQQGVGAIGTTDHVLCAAEFHKPALKLGDLGPQNELSALQYGRNGPLDTVANLLALRSQIDEGRNRPSTLFVHAIP